MALLPFLFRPKEMAAVTPAIPAAIRAKEDN